MQLSELVNANAGKRREDWHNPTRELAVLVRFSYPRNQLEKEMCKG